MYCQHCGKEIEEGVAYCPYCGGVNNQMAAGYQTHQTPVQTPIEVHVSGGSIYECPRCHSTDVKTELSTPVKDAFWEIVACYILGMIFGGMGITFLSNLFFLFGSLAFLHLIILLIRKIFSPAEVWECECNQCHEKYKVRR